MHHLFQFSMNLIRKMIVPLAIRLVLYSDKVQLVLYIYIVRLSMSQVNFINLSPF